MRRLDRQLRNDVAVLCPDRGRYIGTPEHDSARAYIVRRLRDIGVQPYAGEYEHPYSYDGRTMTNVAGVIHAREPRGKPVLIGAHYDSIIPAPCADDNAAAVAIALSAAEALLDDRPRRDVIIAIFDAEEPPYFHSEGMGSVRFYEDHLVKHGVEVGVIMDLVGHDVLVPDSYVKGLGWLEKLTQLFPKQNGCDIAFPGLKDLLFMTGAESHEGLCGIVDQTGLPRGLRLIPTLNRYIGDMSDHAVFRRYDVPYLFLSCGRWPYYHTEADTPEKLNYRKMARIAAYLVRLTQRLCAASLPATAAVPSEEAMADFEIRHLKKTAGLTLPLVLKYLGIERLETRADIDDLVRILLSYGL